MQTETMIKVQVKIKVLQEVELREIWYCGCVAVFQVLYTLDRFLLLIQLSVSQLRLTDTGEVKVVHVGHEAVKCNDFL